ncbi:MAG: hypothetical protein M1831_000097 [Alyxoria varia]|nr:MAG: hypothetical protein M1831_000097 [Alyxoria varia]
MPENSVDSRESQKPWTPARCKRLLRPLACRIANLRTFREVESVKKPPASSIELQEGGYGGWVAGRKQKPMKTYGRHSVAASRLQAHEQPGRKPRSPSGPTQSNQTQILGQKRPMDSDSGCPVPKRRKGDQSSQKNPPQEVIGCFTTILSQTRGEVRRPGAPSLMSMCLRNLPAYIAEEAAYRKTEDKDDKSDVNAETYDFLEERFCIIEGRGWPEFREIVRAQAIHMIKETMDSGLFSWKNVRDLQNRCLWDHELDVNMAITKHALFSGGLCTTAGTVTVSSEEYQIFPREWSHAQLSALFGSQPSALTSLRTGVVQRYLNEIPQHICDGDWRSQVASDLAEIILKCLSGINPRVTYCNASLPSISKTESLKYLRHLSTESQQTDVGLSYGQIVVDLASTLIGSLELRNGCSTKSAVCRLRPIRSASSYVIRSCRNSVWLNEALKMELTGPANAVLMADIIVLILGLDDTAPNDREELIRTRISWITRLSVRISKSFQPAHLDIESVESLIITVSNRVQSSFNAGFARILYVIEFLKDFRSHIPEEESLTSRLAMDAIMRVCTHSDDRGVLQEAECIENEIMHRGTLNMESSPSVRRCFNKRDLRWDTGLCEWIQATPAAPRANGTTRSWNDRHRPYRRTHNSGSRPVVSLPQEFLPNVLSNDQKPLIGERSPLRQIFNWRLQASGEDSLQGDSGPPRRSKRRKVEPAEDTELLHEDEFVDNPQSSGSSDEESSLSLNDTEAEDSDTDELSLTTPRALRDITNQSIRLGNKQDDKPAG